MPGRSERRIRLIAPFGFYGAGNIGDESTLQGFARIARLAAVTSRVWVGSRNPAHTRRIEPQFSYYQGDARRSLRRKWAWRFADAMVVAGGTPIMDALGTWPLDEVVPLVERASRNRKPIAFLGSGTEHLAREESRRIVRDVLGPRVLVWTVRSVRDRARLLEYGIDPAVVVPAADLAWTLDPVTPEFGRGVLNRLGVAPDENLVGVNINAEPFVMERAPHMLDTLATFFDELADQHDARIVFLHNEVREGATFDIATSRAIVAAMRRRDRATIVPNTYWSPRQMLSLVACCRMSVSTRYHFCVFSALQRVPFVAIKRSDKVTDLCHDLDWDHAVWLEQLGDINWLGLSEILLSQRDSLGAHLANRVAALRAKAFTNTTALEGVARAVFG